MYVILIIVVIICNVHTCVLQSKHDLMIWNKGWILSWLYQYFISWQDAASCLMLEHSAGEEYFLGSCASSSSSYSNVSCGSLGGRFAEKTDSQKSPVLLMWFTVLGELGGELSALLGGQPWDPASEISDSLFSFVFCSFDLLFLIILYYLIFLLMNLFCYLNWVFFFIFLPFSCGEGEMSCD